MQWCSWLRPHLDSPCPALDCRTAELAATTSAEFWPGLSGRAFWLCSLRLVFLFAIFRFWGVNRGLFFLYKVRSPTQLPSGSLKPPHYLHDNFTKNGTSLIFSRSRLKLPNCHFSGVQQSRRKLRSALAGTKIRRRLKKEDLSRLLVLPFSSVDKSLTL